MLNEWSDRAPSPPASRSNWLRHAVMFILLGLMLLAVIGGVAVWLLGWLNRIAI